MTRAISSVAATRSDDAEQLVMAGVAERAWGVTGSSHRFRGRAPCVRDEAHRIGSLFGGIVGLAYQREEGLGGARAYRTFGKRRRRIRETCESIEPSHEDVSNDEMSVHEENTRRMTKRRLSKAMLEPITSSTEPYV